MIASATRGESKTTADLRTHSPAVRASSLKCNFAVGVLDRMRMLDFDIDAAYLQGRYTDRRFVASSPARPSTTVSTTSAEWSSCGICYALCTAAPTRAECGTTPSRTSSWLRTLRRRSSGATTSPAPSRTSSTVDEHGAPRRIICSVYVDDGRTWDNCAAVCDGFYERLKKKFSITMDAGTHFMIGMDIAFGEGWLKISSVHEGPRPRTIHQVA